VAERASTELPEHGCAFFLSTIGYRVHELWDERLVPLGLTARQANMLLQVAAAEGKPQLDLARALKIPPSRVVVLVDDLERRRLLRRRGDPTDRRVRTLHLTPQGKQAIGRLGQVVAAHEDAVCSGLEAGGARAVARPSAQGRRRPGPLADRALRAGGQGLEATLRPTLDVS
jgi:DNA-binding MarR family transcriptional regulator